MRRICLSVLCVTTLVCVVLTSSRSVVCSATEVESGWGIATLVETDNAGYALYPRVAIDGSGNAVATWRQHDGISWNIYSNRYVVGWGWGTATLIETSMGTVYGHDLAVDNSGNAIAVWSQSDSTATRTDIYSNRYVVGWGWGIATLIETDDAGNAKDPRVAVDASGDGIAVWSQSDGTRYNIYSNRYAVDTGWGTAMLVETDDVGNAEDPEVAVDASGDGIAVWSQSDGTSFNIWSNRYVVETGWSVATLIEADNAGGASYPQVAVDGSGNAIAVWSQYDGTRANISSNRYVVGAGWGTAVLIETNDTGDAEHPKVAVDSSGSAIAVWDQSDGIRKNIWANRYVVGTGWSTATLIEIDDAGYAHSPQVAVDGSGNAVAVWVQFDGTWPHIYSNRYVVGTGWGAAVLIETDDTSTAGDHQVAVDDLGNAIAVWARNDGYQTNVWANRYVVSDTTPPLLSLVSPADGLTTETPVVTVSGTTEPGVSLVVNGISVAVESDGSFSCEIALVEGENAITATATDASDNSARVSVSITYVNPVTALEEELEETKDELISVRDQLNTTWDYLDAIEDELDDAEDELADVRDELNRTQDELNVLGEELEATQDDLNAAEEELTSTSNDLESVKSQNLALMAVLAIVAILAVVMSVMFMSLRKKIAGMEVKAADEEPPPPHS